MSGLKEKAEEFGPLRSVNMQGGTYEGTLNGQEKPNGVGMLLLDSGEVYKGEFQNGVIHGKGRFEDKSGNWYEGDFVQGKKHGKGEELILERKIDKTELETILFKKERSLRKMETLRNSRAMTISTLAEIHYKGNFKNDKRNGYGN